MHRAPFDLDPTPPDWHLRFMAESRLRLLRGGVEHPSDA